MSASVQDFHSQIASIMEMLANTAVAEICKVVDDGYAVVNLEVSRSQKENEFLRRRIKVLELQISRYRAERLKSPAEGSFCSRYTGVRLLQHRQGRDTPTGLQNRNRFLNRAPQRTSPIILDQDPAQEVATKTQAEPIESEDDSELVIVKVEGNTSINDTTPNLSATIQEPHKESQGFVKKPSNIQDTKDLGHGDGGNFKTSSLEKDQSPIPVWLTPNPTSDQQLSCSTQNAQAGLTLNQVSGNPDSSVSHRKNSQKGSTSKYSQSQTSPFTPAIEMGLACDVSQNNAMSQYNMLPIQNYQLCKVESGVDEQQVVQTWGDGQQVLNNNNFSNWPESTNQDCENQETILPFICTFCSRQFSHHAQLKKHRRIHFEERPYPCVECGKIFGQVSSLKRHRLVHTGERPYPCPHCSKEFTTAGNLKVHQSVHTGERRFNCSTCGKNFSFLSNLIRHQAIHAKK